MREVLFAGLGGFIGTVLRLMVSRYTHFVFESQFPWGTFVVNLAGCFIIGVVYGISEKGDLLSPGLLLFLTAGICGGFTTFSAFSNDALILLRNNEMMKFSLYSGLSIGLGIGMVVLGKVLSKIF